MNPQVKHNFMRAARLNNLEVLKQMICDGIDVNCTVYHGFDKINALHYATMEGHLEIVSELLANGCDVNKMASSSGITPLVIAAQTGTLEMVELLISGGAEVNITDDSCCSPLIGACEKGNLPVVQKLLDSGADPDIQTSDEALPLFVRWQLDTAVSSADFMEICDPYRGNSALMKACREHHLAIVQELILRGCNIHLKNSVGNTALHIASMSRNATAFVIGTHRLYIGGHPDIIKVLIYGGADLDSLNALKQTPLMRAFQGPVVLARYNLNIEEKFSMMQNFFHVITFLVQAGSSLSPTPAYPNSMLYYAVIICKSLVELETGNQRALSAMLLEVMQVLLLAGSRLLPGEFAQLEDECSQFFQQSPDFLKGLKELLETPLTLQEICRIAIRQHLPRPILPMPIALPLPHSLQVFLSMEEWNDMYSQ